MDAHGCIPQHEVNGNMKSMVRSVSSTAKLLALQFKLQTEKCALHLNVLSQQHLAITHRVTILIGTLSTAAYLEGLVQVGVQQVGVFMAVQVLHQAHCCAVVG